MKRIAGLGILLDRSVPNPLKTPDHLFPLPMVCAAVGRRNSGKSTAVASLMRYYKKENLCHRAWLISPNADSPANKRLFEDIVDDGDLYKEPTVASLNAVLEELHAEADEWRKYLRAKEVYKMIRKYIKRPELNVDEIPEELLAEAHLLGVIEDKPEYKYGDIAWPSFHVIMDDVQGTPLMSPSHKNILNSLGLRNRHVHGVGVSLTFCLQTYTSQSGLPSHIRANATVYMLWRFASEERRIRLAKELASDVDMNEFLKCWDDACDPDDTHAFLTISFEDPKARRFRARFDRLVSPAQPQPQSAQLEGED